MEGCLCYFFAVVMLALQVVVKAQDISCNRNAYFSARITQSCQSCNFVCHKFDITHIFMDEDTRPCVYSSYCKQKYEESYFGCKPGTMFDTERHGCVSCDMCDKVHQLSQDPIYSAYMCDFFCKTSRVREYKDDCNTVTDMLKKQMQKHKATLDSSDVILRLCKYTQLEYDIIYVILLVYSALTTGVIICGNGLSLLQKLLKEKHIELKVEYSGTEFIKLTGSFILTDDLNTCFMPVTFSYLPNNVRELCKESTLEINPVVYTSPEMPVKGDSIDKLDYQDNKLTNKYSLQEEYETKTNSSDIRLSLERSDVSEKELFPSISDCDSLMRLNDAADLIETNKIEIQSSLSIPRRVEDLNLFTNKSQHDKELTLLKLLDYGKYTPFCNLENISTDGSFSGISFHTNDELRNKTNTEAQMYDIRRAIDESSHLHGYTEDIQKTFIGNDIPFNGEQQCINDHGANRIYDSLRPYDKLNSLKLHTKAESAECDLVEENHSGTSESSFQISLHSDDKPH